MPRLRLVDAVFLDRDGTINVKPSEGTYVMRPTDLILLPGAAQAVAELNGAGVMTVLVTNQRWLSGPTGNPEQYAAIHSRLRELLAADGAWLDAAYHCPHAVNVCSCRKPAPGMLHCAARDYGLELSRAVTIGDSYTDLQAGRAAGTATILLQPQSADTNQRRSSERLPSDVGADAVATDLAAAVRIVLQARGESRCQLGADLTEGSMRTPQAGHVEISVVKDGRRW
jgi:D-glycero-D-manno-heptose 1,7-bisphosphate phosphatase